MKATKMRTALMVLLTIALALPVFAQEAPGDTEPPPPEAPAAAAPPAAPMLLNLNLEWVNSDICRIIEELRRTRDPWEKRGMVEQIEYMIYTHVEHPLLFKRAEVSDQLDLDRIGTVSDVVDAGTANPLSPLIGEAFALYGIAKGYEGYAAAANDWITRAKAIYPTVEAVTVQLDVHEGRKPIREWMLDSQGNWARTDAVRITIHGKNVAAETLADLNDDAVTFSAKKNDVSKYYLATAGADFMRGLRRYLVTTDKVTEQRPNRFQLYLPPGKYKVGTGASGALPIEIKVSSDPTENHFLVETLDDSVTVYARPKITNQKDDNPKDND
jgi:hypothetical protein